MTLLGRLEITDEITARGAEANLSHPAGVPIMELEILNPEYEPGVYGSTDAWSFALDRSETERLLAACAEALGIEVTT